MNAYHLPKPNRRRIKRITSRVNRLEYLRQGDYTSRHGMKMRGFGFMGYRIPKAPPAGTLMLFMYEVNAVLI